MRATPPHTTAREFTPAVRAHSGITGIDLIVQSAPTLQRMVKSGYLLPPQVIHRRANSLRPTVDQFAAVSVIVEDKIVRLARPITRRGIGRRFLMVMEKYISPRRATRPDVATSRSAPNEVERVRLSKWRPAGSAVKGIDLADGAPPQTLLDAVEDQRMNLLNVLGIVRSMSTSFVDAAGDSAPEICAAFALLEQEIQRVAAGLEEGSLRNAL